MQQKKKQKQSERQCKQPQEGEVMLVRDLLKAKGSSVITIRAGSTIKQAMEVLIRHNIGAVMVVNEEGNPVGIVSERDILRESHNHLDRAFTTIVDSIMSTDLIIGLPDDTLEYVECVITDNKIRHLPIMENGKMIGIISIGDIVKALLQHSETQIHYLRDYIMDKYPG